MLIVNNKRGDKMKRKIPVSLDLGQTRKLIDMPNPRVKTGLRNKAILSLMVDSGMRASEVINLRPGDINYKDRIVTIIAGKKNVDRFAGYSAYTGELLKQYKAQRPKGPTFFCSAYVSNCPRGSKKKIGNKLSRVYLHQMISKYAVRAGIKKKVGCHTLRHTFALQFYKDSGHDLKALQRILGHADIATTGIYGYMDSSDVKESLSAYYKERDGLHYKDADIVDRIKALDKQIKGQQEELQLLKGA